MGAEVSVCLMPIPVIELCIKAGFCKTKSEARRLCRQGAIRVNDVKVDELYQVTTRDLRWTEELS